MLAYREIMDCIFVDKPDGWSTHSPGLGHRGLVELFSSRLNYPLLVAHRLDKTTSGALVFAKTGIVAEKLRQDFQSHRVKKTYLFLTDKTSTQSEYEIESEIEKSGSLFKSDRDSKSPNAFTFFRRVKRSPFFELWEAHPRSGKPHQIRLHAKDIGLPILGDVIYGGSPFPRLCLHSRDLQIPDYPLWSCPPPRLFERLGLLKDQELARILCSIDQRQRLFSFLEDRKNTLRLMDFEDQDLALDLLGSQLWLHWYRDSDPTPRDLERWGLISWMLDRPLTLQKRVNRGADLSPASRWEIGPIPEDWIATEDNNNFLTHYQMRKNQGESYGLFLDQRANRTRLAEVAKGKSILNLFAYTGGFGAVAAKAGASAVTTVDLSSSSVEWSKDNFKTNELSLDSNEFFAADCFFFLDRAQKKNRRWDIIVCDPPIFSRSKEKIFRIEKDFASLIRLCEKVLNPGGWILFSTHYQGWDQKTLKNEIRKSFSGLILDGHVDIDYSQEHPLKSYWLQKLE